MQASQRKLCNVTSIQSKYLIIATNTELPRRRQPYLHAVGLAINMVIQKYNAELRPDVAHDIQNSQVHLAL